MNPKYAPAHRRSLADRATSREAVREDPCGQTRPWVTVEPGLSVRPHSQGILLERGVLAEGARQTKARRRSTAGDLPLQQVSPRGPLIIDTTFISYNIIKVPCDTRL